MNKTSQVTYVTMVPRVGNETLRPLGVATGNALSVTRSEDTYEKTPPVGRRQPMTSLPACHNISAAGRKHHQLLRLKLASEAWLEAQGTQCLVPHSGNHGYIRNLRRSPSWELELRPLGVATGNVIPTSPCWGECKPISQKGEHQASSTRLRELPLGRLMAVSDIIPFGQRPELHTLVLTCSRCRDYRA